MDKTSSHALNYTNVCPNHLLLASPFFSYETEHPSIRNRKYPEAARGFALTDKSKSRPPSRDFVMDQKKKKRREGEKEKENRELQLKRKLRRLRRGLRYYAKKCRGIYSSGFLRRVLTLAGRVWRAATAGLAALVSPLPC